MFEKFTIDPAAKDKARFEDLRETWWVPHGILVHSGSFNPRYRKEIQVAIKNFASVGWPLVVDADSIDWQSMRDCSDLDQYQDTFALVLLGEDRAQAFDVPNGSNDKYSKVSGDIEAIRFIHAGLAERFREAKSLSQKEIQKGTPVEDLWQERFSLLSRHSKLMNVRIPQVAIVDRYAVNNIITKERNDGLFNLLRFIHADPPGCEVTIYSEFKDREDHNRIPEIQKEMRRLNGYKDRFKYWSDEVRRRLDAEIAKLGLSKDKGIKKIQVHIRPSRTFGSESHARHIRFNAYTCVIDTGVEVFCGNKVPRRADFSLKPPAEITTYTAREDSLRYAKNDYGTDSWRWRG